MTLLTALAAISTIATQGSVMSLGGRVVQVTYPSQVIRQVPDEVKSWDGFKGISASQEWPTPFKEVGDWSAITSKLSTLGPVTKETPEWKTKVFLLTQTDTIGNVNGLHVQMRHRLDQQQIDSVLKSIARTQGYVRAVTDGAVTPVFDLEIDSDPVVLGVGQQGSSWEDDYIRARTNRGSFVAEDKQFRGPYQSVILITPANFGNISVFGEWTGKGECYGLEKQIGDQIARQAYFAWLDYNVYSAAQGGGQGGYQPYLQTEFPTALWRLLQSSSEPTFENVSEMYQLAPQVRQGRDNVIEFPWRPAPISPNVQVSIVTDDQRGSVLRYAENSPIRGGGLALPYQNVDLLKTPFLSFWVKSSSRDSLGIHVNDQSSKAPFARRQQLVFERDGAWHQVIVDLRNREQKQAVQMFLGPLTGQPEREQVGDIVYLFDDFELLANAEANQPAVAPLSAEAQRALGSKGLSAADLVKETSDLVRLNSLLLRDTPYAASDEAALIELTKSVNSRIAGEAVKKLAQLESPTAKAEVLRLVTSSPFEYVKQVAAIEVGKMGDAKMAGILSRLFASKSWQSRNAGAKAVTLIPGDEPAVIAMTFLQETDPVVRLTVTKGANVQNPVVLKRFLWSTVNDPSDAVRAESAWRLITSGKEKEVAEGYKAVRDDSVGVRLDLVRRMEKNPSEAHRGALRIAVIDLSPRVRAAALQAFAKQPGEVTAEEVANTFEDKFPMVQLALLDLAQVKKIALPANAVQTLKASIDPRVVEKAKELGS